MTEDTPHPTTDDGAQELDREMVEELPSGALYLHHLIAHHEPVRRQEVLSRSGFDVTKARKLLDSLREGGFVSVQQSESDARESVYSVAKKRGRTPSQLV